MAGHAVSTEVMGLKLEACNRVELIELTVTCIDNAAEKLFVCVHCVDLGVLHVSGSMHSCALCALSRQKKISIEIDCAAWLL